MNAQVMGREQLLKNLSSYKENLVDAVATAAEIVQAKVSNFAKDHHPYKDRTENLTISIEPGEVRITNERVEAEVQARMPYASYVELGTSRSRPYPFMHPALIAHQSEFIQRVASAFRRNKP